MTSKNASRRRSTCPINASLELLGDRWSLLIVRDLVFAGLRTYKEFLSGEEGIATNILADRLASLQASGLITSDRDPEDGRKLVYRLTAKGFDLAPALLELGRWAVKYEAGVRRPEPLRRWEADRDRFLEELRKERLERSKERSAPTADTAASTASRAGLKMARGRARAASA